MGSLEAESECASTSPSVGFRRFASDLLRSDLYMDHSLRTTQTTGEGRRPLHPSLLILIHPFSKLGNIVGKDSKGTEFAALPLCQSLYCEQQPATHSNHSFDVSFRLTKATMWVAEHVVDPGPGAEVFSVIFLVRNALVVLCPLLPSAAAKALNFVSTLDQDF